MEDETKNVEGTDETVTSQDKNEKLLTQEQVNKLLADERRKLQKKYSDLETSFNEFKNDVESERSKREEKIKTQVEELKKGLPEPVLKLLGKLSVEEQYEWIQENPIEKKTLPDNPKGENGESKPKPKSLGTLF